MHSIDLMANFEFHEAEGQTPMIRVQRVYDAPAEGNGTRFLVERLWPRGVRKAALHLDGWPKEIAPSTELRRWFAHDRQKWPEFQRRYRQELEANRAAWQPLLEAACRGTIILIYGARDTEHNSALVLKALLEKQLAAGR